MLQNLRKPLNFRPQTEAALKDKAFDQVAQHPLQHGLPEMEVYPDWLGIIEQDHYSYA